MANSKPHQIYILRDGVKVFIGKSTDSRINSVKWRHQRGENACTRAHFTREIAPDLELRILTTLHTDHREAHRFVIAFIRFFLENGYIVLNSDGMVQEALSLYPATNRVLQKLQNTPLSVWLGEEDTVADPNTTRATAITSFRNQKEEHSMASECFSTRLYPNEAAFIQQIMDDLQITKHQIMAIFLDTYQHRDEESPDWTCADYVKIFMQPLRDRISTQQAEIDSLKAQISQLKQQQEKQLTNRENLSRSGMRRFLNYFEPNDSTEQLRSDRFYRDFLTFVSNAREYTYPVNEEFFIFYPAEIFYGSTRSKARFIIGTDDDGKKTLLRFYPKSYYTGMFLTNKIFGLVDSRWLVRAERANDGAMDIIFSFPLNIILKNQHAVKKDSSSDLESILEDASWRSKEFLEYFGINF